MKNINNNIIKNNVYNDNINNVYNNINNSDYKDSNSNNNINNSNSYDFNSNNNNSKIKLLKPEFKIKKESYINNKSYSDNINNKCINSTINKNENELENLINEIEQETTNDSEIKINNKDIKNKTYNIKNELGYYNVNSNINNMKELEKYYHIDDITGDGNCLFYSLSNIIFKDMRYYVYIRQIICEYYETTDALDSYFENEREKKDYINKMKKDKEYGTGLELGSFCNMLKIKIILFTRHITDVKLKKTHNDKVDSLIIGNLYEGNFAIILDNYKINDNFNHYSSLRPKNNKNSLNNDRLNEIRNSIINKYPNLKIDKIISGKTGKIVGERKGKSEWNLMNL